MRVLFVGELPRALEDVQRSLRDCAEAWDVHCVRGGREALAALEAEAFDTVVTELGLSGMDGAELLAAVRSRWPSVTRVALARQGAEGAAMRALSFAHQFLSKPCTPDKLRDAVERARALQSLIASERVRALAAGVDHLPPMPKVYRELVDLLEDPESSVGDAGVLVAQDPGLSAKILQVVNSAFFSRGASVNDVRTATSRLGLDVVRGIVLAAGTLDRVGEGISAERMRDLQSVALQAAALACGMLPPSEHRVAFTAALLCDVGSLVLERFAKREVQAAQALVARYGAPRHVAERSVLGASHAEVGAYLLALWNIPQIIVDTVATHHEPERDPRPGSRLSAVVHVAHHVVAGLDIAPFALERAAVRDRIDELRQLAASVGMGRAA